MMLIVMMAALTGCYDYQPSSDQVQSHQQEQILKEGTQEVGMPAIKNFQERKLMKLILEKRDDANLKTYLYTKNEMNGKFRFIGNTMGFGLPGATEFTSPEKVSQSCGNSQVSGNGGYWCVEGNSPQADPNGLFMPSSEDATWVLMVNPSDPKDIEPVYMESQVNIFPFQLPDNEVEKN
jgi:hypothetical protein